MTPLSTSTSYCSPAVLQTFYDVRQLGDLADDAGTRVDATSLLTHPAVQKALDWASGEIESACLAAGRYRPADLAGLIGAGQALLQGLCADLAFWKLTLRRFPDAKPTAAYEAAQKKLERLRLGERIFGTEESADAGLPRTEFVQQQDIDTLGATTTLSRRFWGRRVKEARLEP